MIKLVCNNPNCRNQIETIYSDNIPYIHFNHVCPECSIWFIFNEREALELKITKEYITPRLMKLYGTFGIESFEIKHIFSNDMDVGITMRGNNNEKI